ncbi:HotDog domain-containing protein [Penicillium subrubescens]|uniref:HotDog domain-containing protein n=1 Tax=Penicillium subrubescens TaxID=1316194 RepID=UPI0025451BD3|nr:HotDog domain-containing protein [Penicillium subrubescens]KAJ5873598.1 HotDog domain-containing protein [Penicillium subrubescens]
MPKLSESSFGVPQTVPGLNGSPFVSDLEKLPYTNSLHHNLLHGYRPELQRCELGQQATALMALEPRQRICFYPGKIHGGYQAFLLDQLFADCCKPAVTANLSVDFKRPIQPNSRLILHVWPVKIEGRKIFMEGSIQVDDQLGERLLCASASALFIVPRC